MKPAIERDGLLPLLRDLLSYPLPKGVGWPQVFGSLLLISLAIQLITGVLLALYYSPSATDAYQSIQYIENEVRSGSLIRGLHHFGSSSFVILLVLHVARTFIWGAYKAERKWTWVTGCLLFCCVLAFGFTGFLLPWDLKAFFGTRVGVEIAGSTPLIGGFLEKLLAGGVSVGELTLPRFYALHATVLPLITVGLIALHLTLLRLHGITPGWRGDATELSGRYFHPHQLAKDLGVGLVLLLVLLAVASIFKTPLDARADPLNASYVPRPEWYFLGLQQLLRIFQGDFEIIGSFVLPTIAASAIVLLPWIDRNPERAPGRRPVAMGVGILAAFTVISLTIWGERELRAEERIMAERNATRASLEAAEEADQTPERDELPPPDEAQLVARGRVLYAQLSCGACHDDFDRGPATPGLSHEGSMVRREWLREYLAHPHRIRFESEDAHPVVRMPDFLLREEELESIVAYLMSLRDAERIPDREFASPPNSNELETGAQLVFDYDCRECHVLAGEGSKIGPALDGVGSRLTTNFMAALVLDPEGVIPGTSMTDYLMPEDEAVAIARYLESLK